MDDAQTLYSIAKLEAELTRAKRELESFPQAAQIMECRSKRKELKGKQDQVVELTDEVNAKIGALEQEEAALIAKIKELQHTLDTTRDYRMTGKLTDEMNSLVSRQADISKETDALLERQIKIDNVANQVSDMLAKVDHKEQHLSAEFKEQGGRVKAKIDDLQSGIDEAMASLDPKLAARYKKLKEEKGGIGVAWFEQTHCSVCHVEFQAGALAKLKAAGDIAECPSCHRIFLPGIAAQ